MVYDCPKTVYAIQNFIKEKKKNNRLPSSKTPIREDVFSIIETESILLYYPLDDPGVKGCHVERMIGDELKHFVFINTTKPVEEQTWTAAHELGHVWGIDKEIVYEKTGEEVDKENIVNRFASELLFPKDIFRKSKESYFEIKNLNEENLSKNEFVGLITYMMNYFCAPYKAVIRRFVELGMIERDNEAKYIGAFEANKEYYNQLLLENYYTRLGYITKSCQMSNISDDLVFLEREGSVSEEHLKEYRKLFKLKEESIGDETFIVGGKNGSSKKKGCR
jgi:Zn-dependent peptidase ImmA (M78 family)